MNKLTKIFLESDQNDFYTLKVDMDGCLTNFELQFQNYTGQPMKGYEECHGKAKFWSIIEKTGEKFWSEMPWMPDGQELWNYIQKYNPTILSAPSRDPKCITGKVKWIKEHLNLPNYNLQLKSKHGWDGTSKIILNSEKYRYCSGPKDILIDDTPKKINPWIQKGGVGILHTSTENTINKLKELGL